MQLGTPASYLSEAPINSAERPAPSNVRGEQFTGGSAELIGAVRNPGAREIQHPVSAGGTICLLLR